ncbi:MAG TPA: inorganic phosphate transporter [Cytophagaceae bacterium]|nr:inorganic phosphate transporter [Cytophagaceae bacterium]
MLLTLLSLLHEINLSSGLLLVFAICLIAVLGFEFVNGFHDTANAVATVIYTHALKPKVAVIWSGVWNFIGVFSGGVAVAMGILKLVPLNELIALPVYIGACLVLAVLISSIIWNVGTWYFGIPCSSSHTLIGSMIGASLGFTLYYGGSGVNWGKAEEIGLSLIMSPLFGFGAAILLMYFLSHVIKAKQLFHIPQGQDKPPLLIRGLLILTCTLVSFFHGSNDGQKGVGLLMLILMVFVPAHFALNHEISDEKIMKALTTTEQTVHKMIADGHQE